MRCITFPRPLLQARWQDTKYRSEGITQPWIQQLLYNCIIATRATSVLELGCFRGVTTAWFACAVEALGGGRVVGLDTNAIAVKEAIEHCAQLELRATELDIRVDESLKYLRTLDAANAPDFIFIDDQKLLIAQEIEALINQGVNCLVAVHDVDQPQLEKYWPAIGGVVIPSPKVGSWAPTGYLGLLNIGEAKLGKGKISGD